MIRLHPQLLFACAIFAVACDKTDPNTSGDDRPKTTDAATPSPIDDENDGAMDADGAADVGTPDDAPPDGMAAQLTDPQIFHVLTTANTGEVDEAELVLGKTKDPAVKAFADAMVADHGAANDKGKALASKLAVTPEDNPISQALKKAHEETMAKLGSLEGAAFDQGYADAAVAAHTQVLETIDRSILPSAENAELEAMVTEIRPTIAAHLEHAKTLQAKLGGAKPTP